jgi:hypothetical protein
MRPGKTVEIPGPIGVSLTDEKRNTFNLGWLGWELRRIG